MEFWGLTNLAFFSNGDCSEQLIFTQIVILGSFYQRALLNFPILLGMLPSCVAEMKGCEELSKKGRELDGWDKWDDASIKSRNGLEETLNLISLQPLPWTATPSTIPVAPNSIHMAKSWTWMLPCFLSIIQSRAG